MNDKSFRELVFKQEGKTSTEEEIADNLDELRKETSEIETRLRNTLRELFKSFVLPWDQWFLANVESIQNRNALGIPSYLNTDDLVRVLGTRVGFSKSFRDMIACRIDRIFTQVSKTLAHPLCSDELRSFREIVEKLRESLGEPEGTPYQRIDSDKVKRVLDNHKKDFEAAKKELLSKFFQSYFDPFSYILLQSVEENINEVFINIAYNLKTEKREKSYQRIKELLNNCKKLKKSKDELYIEDHNYYQQQGIKNNSRNPFVLLWFYYWSEFIREPNEKFGNSYKKLGYKEKTVKGLFSTLEYNINKKKLKENRIASLGGLFEFLEYESSDLHVVPPSLCDIAVSLNKKNKQGLKNASAPFDFLKKVFNKNIDDKTGLFWHPDHGHLYFLCLRYWAALEFWKWDSFFLLKNNKILYKTFNGNPEAFWSIPIFNIIKNEELTKLKEKETLEKDGIKPIKESVILLGGAGIGKTKLLEALYYPPFNATRNRLTKIPKSLYLPCYSENGNYKIPFIVKITPPELEALEQINHYKLFELQKLFLTDNWRCLQNNERPKFLILFVDEIHLAQGTSIFGELLAPLEEGRTINLKIGGTVQKLPIQFVFASSKYRSKQEFLSQATKSNNIAMRDFATRIGHWVELPDLATIPEQRAVLIEALIGNRQEDAMKNKKKIQFYLDLSKRSSRELKQSIESTKDEVNIFERIIKFYFPKSLHEKLTWPEIKKEENKNPGAKN